MLRRRITISVEYDLHRIIQKMRGFILGETGIEISFTDATNILLHWVILENGNLNKGQLNYFRTVARPVYPEDNEIHEYMDIFFKEELPRIVDKMIERDVPELKKK